jgi:hypothetical protein
VLFGKHSLRVLAMGHWLIYYTNDRSEYRLTSFEVHRKLKADIPQPSTADNYAVSRLEGYILNAVAVHGAPSEAGMEHSGRVRSFVK